MSNREPEELPAPLTPPPGMPQQISAKERVAALVWIAVALYFVYILALR